MMKNWKSILFAVLIFALLSVYEAQAQAFSLDSTEVKMVLRDNENAHVVAGAALGALSCVLESISNNAEWTPQECVDKLEEIIEPYSQEHIVLHPMVVYMLESKMKN